jgi:hypothetical protein
MLNCSEAAVEQAMKVQEVILRAVAKDGSSMPYNGCVRKRVRKEKRSP